MATLHVLNGDSTAHQMREAAIEGDTAIWREVMCDGATVYNIESPASRKARMNFFTQFLSASEQGYKTKVLLEIEKLKNWGHYDEIVLWFEYDMFCQINMVAAVSWFYQQNCQTPLSLVCVGKVEGYSKLMGLGELPYESFPQLFRQRLTLTNEDITYLDSIWRAYCSDSHMRLMQLVSTKDNTQFPYLRPALLGHITRFAQAKDGMNQIEHRILNLIETGESSVVSSKKSLIRTLLMGDNTFGFGDMQYAGYIEHLNLLWEESDGLRLTDLGVQAKSGNLSFRKYRSYTYDYGGVNMYTHAYDQSSAALI